MTAHEFREYAMSVLAYEPTTGVFTWRVRKANFLQVGDRAGHITRKGYVRIHMGRTSYMAHRLAWLFVHGEFPPGQLDHEDRDRSNNRIGNLRPATDSENQQNRLINVRNKSGFKGVSFEKRWAKWKAEIQVNKAAKFLGYFPTPEAAYAAYCQAAARLHTHAPSSIRQLAADEPFIQTAEEVTMSKKIDMEKWLKSGQYLPPPLRDFHDQKDVFKLMHSRINVEGHEYAKVVDWIAGQCYVIDIFLWFMARRGWTLQRSRTALEFNDLDAEVKEPGNMLAALQDIYNDLKQGAIPNHDDEWWERARAAIARATGETA